MCNDPDEETGAYTQQDALSALRGNWGCTRNTTHESDNFNKCLADAGVTYAQIRAIKCPPKSAGCPGCSGAKFGQNRRR